MLSEIWEEEVSGRKDGLPLFIAEFASLFDRVNRFLDNVFYKYLTSNIDECHTSELPAKREQCII